MQLWQLIAANLTFAVCSGNRQAAIVALCFLSDWALCSSVPDLDGMWPWPIWSIIDLATGFCIAAISSSRVGQLIALSYAVELACHASFGLSGNTPSSLYYYWQSTHYIAWAQACVLVVWLARDWARYLGGHVDAANYGGFPSHRRRYPYYLRWAQIALASAKARTRALAPAAVELFILALFVMRNDGG